MTGTEVVQPKTLEERVRAKLHESIGDLIQPEDIKAIVERGIEEYLFKPRVVEGESNWGNSGRIKVSLVQELIEQKLKTQVTSQIEAWLKQNPEKLQAALDQAIAKGVGNAIMRALDLRFESVFEGVLKNLQNQGFLSGG